MATGKENILFKRRHNQNNQPKSLSNWTVNTHIRLTSVRTLYIYQTFSLFFPFSIRIFCFFFFWDDFLMNKQTFHRQLDTAIVYNPGDFYVKRIDYIWWASFMFLNVMRMFQINCHFSWNIFTSDFLKRLKPCNKTRRYLINHLEIWRDIHSFRLIHNSIKSMSYLENMQVSFLFFFFFDFVPNFEISSRICELCKFCEFSPNLPNFILIQ